MAELADLARPVMSHAAGLQDEDGRRQLRHEGQELVAAEAAVGVEAAGALPAVQRFLKIPGIGLIVATALVGFVGDLRRFPSARHFASYLGLTPREYSTGLRHRLGRISERGDAYLRMLLIHGARAVLSRAAESERPDRLRAWVLALRGRAHHNKTAVALANKMARIAWALSVRDTEYRIVPAAA